MILALATRGYLVQFRPIQVVMGDGPPITGAKALLPKIEGASSTPGTVKPPSIVGSNQT